MGKIIVKFLSVLIVFSFFSITTVLPSSLREISLASEGQQPKTEQPQATQATQATQSPQNKKSEEEDEKVEAIKIGGEVVLLNVLVTDVKNRYVQSIGKEDFELYEDGKKQEISFFSKQNEPISLCIMIDASTSMIENGKLVEAINAAKALIANGNPKDEVCLMKFDDRTTLIQDFTSDSKLLNEQTKRIKPFGGTAMYDALARGMIHTNKNSKQLRQAIVLITDGLDQHSRKTFADIIPIAQLTGIPCYIIGIYTPDEKRAFATGQQKIKLDTGSSVDNPELVLRNLAEETAGRVFFPSSERELVPIAEQVADELRNGYAVGYYPPDSSLDGKYHTISVVSKSKKYTVRARRGYISKLPE
jgi:VWFA-related protein